MGDRSSKQSGLRPTAVAPVAGVSLTPRMLIMFRAFLGSPHRTKLLLLGVAIIAVIGATAFGQLRLNAWNQPFYDALAHKDFRAFLDQLTVFGVIASVLLVLNVAQAWLTQMTKVKLREWLVCSVRRVAQASACFSPGQYRRDGHQPRLAHPRGRAPPD